MNGIAKSLAFRALLALFLMSAPAMLAQQKKEVTAAPLPTQIPSAHKIFISNGGDDSLVKDLGANRSYNDFYSAMKSWGARELVGAPSEADLVLEIRLDARAEDFGGKFAFVPLLRLAISDPKTHTTLWALSEELETGAIFFVGSRQDSKYKKAMDRIVADAKALMLSPPA